MSMFVALITLGFFAQAMAQTMDPCDFKYFYPNTGDDFANDDVSVSIACLEPGGCETIVYARATCGGCFSTCTDTNRVVFSNVAAGDVVSVSNTELNFAIGDLICATGQVAAISRDSTAVQEESHEWSGNNLAGTRFVFLTQRAGSASCTVYAFDDSTTVALTPESGSAGGATLSAFSAQTFGTFNANGNLLTITATNPVVVSCWDGSQNDFVVLEPVTTNPIYGFSSTHYRGMQVDCNTLANTLGTANLPTCVNSDGQTITLSYTSGDRHFDMPGTEDGDRYAGNGLKCSPVPGDCIAGGTVADKDGSEGTTAFSTLEFGSFFVAPDNIDQVVVLSRDSPVTCDVVRSGVPSQLVTVTGSAGSSEVHIIGAGTTLLFQQGSTINCTEPVYIVASFGEDEFNLLGYKDPSAFSYIPPSYVTCAPTSSPTTPAPSTSPTTSEPTTSPTTSAPSESPTTSAPSTSPTTSEPTQSPFTPSASPTGAPSVPPTINVPVVAGSSLGALVACAAIIAFVIIRRRREAEARKDSMMLNPDVYIEDEGFGEQREDHKGVQDYVGNHSAQGSGGVLAAISATLRRKPKGEPKTQTEDTKSLDTEDGTLKEAMIEPGKSKKGAGLISAIGASLARKKPAEKADQAKKEGEGEGKEKEGEEDEIDEELEASLLTFGNTKKRKAGSDFEVNLDEML